MKAFVKIHLEAVQL